MSEEQRIVDAIHLAVDNANTLTKRAAALGIRVAYETLEITAIGDLVSVMRLQVDTAKVMVPEPNND